MQDIYEARATFNDECYMHVQYREDNQVYGCCNVLAPYGNNICMDQTWIVNQPSSFPGNELKNEYCNMYSSMNRFGQAEYFSDRKDVFCQDESPLFSSKKGIVHG